MSVFNMNSMRDGSLSLWTHLLIHQSSPNHVISNPHIDETQTDPYRVTHVVLESRAGGKVPLVVNIHHQSFLHHDVFSTRSTGFVSSSTLGLGPPPEGTHAKHVTQ